MVLFVGWKMEDKFIYLLKVWNRIDNQWDNVGVTDSEQAAKLWLTDNVINGKPNLDKQIETFILNQIEENSL